MAKTVYGGGGIMPDVYVAIEADTTMAYYNRLANSGQLFQFAFDYADQHRPELMAYGSVDNFRQQFKFTDAIYRDLQAFAAEKGVKGSKLEQGIARDRIAILFKPIWDVTSLMIPASTLFIRKLMWYCKKQLRLSTPKQPCSDAC